MSNEITDYINTDRFRFFLHWLNDERKFNGRDLINVMFEPYKYKQEWAEFHNEVYNKEEE